MQRSYRTRNLFDRWFQGLDKGIIKGCGLILALSAGVLISAPTQASFLQFSSIGIIFGGLFAIALMQFSPVELHSAWKSFRALFEERDSERVNARMRYLTDLALQARKRGFMVLEDASERTDDPFLTLALQLAVDRQQESNIHRILETEMRCRAGDDARVERVFRTLGEYAPAMGLIGTLLGLVQMLSSLGDVAGVGPAMSMALLTTLYGAVLSNFVFLPAAGRVAAHAEEERLMRQATLEAVLSIAREESTIVLGQRLSSFVRKQA